MDALELANSISARRGRIVDALDPALGLHELRATVRTLFEAAVAGERPPPDVIAAVNRLATAPRLRWDASGPHLVDDGIAETARTAIELLADGRLRACGNPRCIRFFLADGHRSYCSHVCANRARVARHAARHRR